MTDTLQSRTPPTDGRRSATEPLEPDASIGDLLGRVSEDFSDLVRSHVELAKVEVKEEMTRAGKGAGMLTGGVVSALMALVFLSSALAWGLAELMDAGWAFLIVGLLWAGAATLLAMTGRQELKTVHPVPEATKQTVQEDFRWAQQTR